MSGTGKNLKILAVIVVLAIAGAACGTARAVDQSAAAPTNLLVITPDDESGVLRIAPRPAKTHHHLLR